MIRIDGKETTPEELLEIIKPLGPEAWAEAIRAMIEAQPKLMLQLLKDTLEPDEQTVE